MATVLVRALHVRIATAWKTAFGPAPPAVDLLTEAGTVLTDETGANLNA